MSIDVHEKLHTGNSLELPPTSSLVIGVNEIKDGAIEIEH